MAKVEYRVLTVRAQDKNSVRCVKGRDWKYAAGVLDRVYLLAVIL
jgi:hypothetical protein